MEFCDSQLNFSANHKTIEMPISIVLLVLYRAQMKNKKNKDAFKTNQNWILSFSPRNRTPVSRLADGFTHHYYTIEEMMTLMGKNALFDHTKILNCPADSNTEMLSSNILLVFEIHAPFAST